MDEAIPEFCLANLIVLCENLVHFKAFRFGRTGILLIRDTASHLLAAAVKNIWNSILEICRRLSILFRFLIN